MRTSYNITPIVYNPRKDLIYNIQNNKCLSYNKEQIKCINKVLKKLERQGFYFLDREVYKTGVEYDFETKILELLKKEHKLFPMLQNSLSKESIILCGIIHKMKPEHSSSYKNLKKINLLHYWFAQFFNLF